MKKAFLSILVLSLLLAILVACGAQAKEPDAPEPAPAPQADQIEPAGPEQPAEPAEPITDIEPIAEPETVADVEPEPEPEPMPENIWTFTDCNETVYAISTVNLRSGPSTDYEKVGSLSTGDSVTRTGIGTGDYENWSRVILSDGTEVYVSSNYVSTTKPAAQQTTTQSKPSGTTQSGGTTTSTSTPSGGGTTTSQSSEDANKQWAESQGHGLAGLKGYVAPSGPLEEGAGEGRYNDPSVAVNMG